MGTAALSDGDYVHSVMAHADLIIIVGHDIVEKPPFFMNHHDARRVLHISYVSAVVGQSVIQYTGHCHMHVYIDGYSCTEG